MEIITNFLQALIGDNFVAGLGNLGQIIMIDIVLSADNALIIGLAAAGLAPELRKKAIFFGMAIAAALRIVFTLIISKLLGVPFIRLFGAILLVWVCYRLFKEILDQHTERVRGEMGAHGLTGDEDAATTKRTLFSALVAIAVADFSMSLDNALAVAEVAHGNDTLLIFGLVLAIILMAFFATMILKLLERFPIISWIGLLILCFVARDMFSHGISEALGTLGEWGWISASPPSAAAH